MAEFYIAKAGDGGSDANPGTSVGSPKLTIPAGMALLSSGDALNIRRGTYTDVLPQSSIPAGTNWSSPTTIKAYNGESVTLTGGGASIGHFNSNQSYIVWDGFVFDIADNFIISNGAHHIKLTNFEIKNSVDNGLQIGLTSDGNIISHGLIHDIGSNPSGPPHAIYASCKNSVFEYLTIYNNPNGGGVHLFDNSSPGINGNVVRFCVVHDMTSFGILLSNGRSNLVYRNICYSNGTHGIQLFGGANLLAEILNNTTYGNASFGIIVDIALPTPCSGTFKNNIAYGNGGGQISISLDTARIEAANLTTDPFFTNPGSGDFSLQSGSPAINAGVIVDGVSYAGPVPDQGALEFGAEDLPNVGVTVTPNPIPPGDTGTVDWTSDGDSVDVSGVGPGLPPTGSAQLPSGQTVVTVQANNTNGSSFVQQAVGQFANGLTLRASLGHTPRSIKAGSDMSVDNLEIITLMPSRVKVRAQSLIIRGLDDQDIEIGALDHAGVEIFHVNHQAPSMGKFYLPGSGNIGQVKIRRISNEAELRGKMIYMQQTFGGLVSRLCDAIVGDDITDYRRPGFGCGVRLRPPRWPGLGSGTEQLVRISHTLTNPGFETGDLTGWTTESGSFSIFTSPTPAAHGGTKSAGASTGKLYQRIDLVAAGVNTAEIDLGVLALRLQAWVNGGNSNLDVRIGVRFLNASQVTLSESFNATSYKTSSFTQELFAPTMPPLTRYADIILKCSSFLGGPAYFDDVTADTMLVAVHQDVRIESDAKTGAVVRPNVYTGRDLKCIVAGGSDLVEPVCPTRIGDTVVDGTVTWEAIQALTVFGTVSTVLDSRIFSDNSRTEPPTMGIGVNAGTAQYAIRNVDKDNKRFFLEGGDLTGIFRPTNTFQVTGSPANDGTYTIVTATVVGSRTRITVAESIPSNKDGGFVTAATEHTTGFFEFGKLTFLSGYNKGIMGEVKTFNLTPYPIVVADTGTNVFEIEGDQTAFFAVDQRIAVKGSTGNDNPYDVVSVTYNAGTDHTEIEVLQLIDDATADGSLLAGPGQFEMFDEFPYPIQAGDKYMASAGCDQSEGICIFRFDNIHNRRAEAEVPGTDVATRSTSKPL